MSMRLKNLIGTTARLQARLAGLTAGDEAALARLAGEARAVAEMVDALCAQRGATPAELPPQSRHAFL